MAVVKCKMCGGDLRLIEGQSVAECEYCGSRQTVPTADSEKKLTLFARANRLRASCEFDKAVGVYESIVADFPEEAEAYWGLVLCKYGIEYVDDPATGKKVPTCHRSSFDSVLEDSDFEQACENADSIARKVYREEAKEIEEIRKGIIEVSGKEQPYDIFICYKETDENGDRTIDSVIAQDVYDALTAKGYRVFFSRITLEDKLGREYEPYIFAALNSAKIMLAFGTDFEYFNAVWVKNEWSRYLKLMASDKSKHLIPCYKDIDAYDMPKEFAKLQAQDMGKVGAIQDLLRGIDKLLSKAAPVTVVQEQVVVSGSGGKQVDSLLDRGNMALEDGDWAKADSFFEDVLNNDSRNAQAYLGKALAEEQCRTMDALVQKWKDATQEIQGETLKLAADEAHISEMVKKCSVPGYVSQDEIRRLYAFDLSYYSEVSGRKRQYENTEHDWAEHKQLSRTEKFAVGPAAENLAREKKALFAALSDRVKAAERAEDQAKKDLRSRYEAHLRQADEEAEKRYHDGCARREADYQTIVRNLQNACDIPSYTNVRDALKAMSSYKDVDALAEKCQKNIDRLNEEERRIAAKKRKRTIAIATPSICACLAIIIVLNTVIIPNSKYYAAIALMEAGNYEDAITAFEAMEGYKDSEAQIESCKYRAAVALMEAGNYKDALTIFAALDNYEDAKQKKMECLDQTAVRESIDASTFNTVGLKSDGTVIATRLTNKEHDYGQCDVSGWTDIVAVSAGYGHTVGLKSDGTVVAVGYNKYGQCNVSGWTDIVAVSAGMGHTVGLKSDGTVVAVGYNEDGQCGVGDWTDIVAVSAGSNYTVGLKSDGTVVAVGTNSCGQCDVSDWTDIMAVSAGTKHTVGLKFDGTVVAVGTKDHSKCDVSDWTDIMAVSAGTKHTVGLKSDGTVVAVGSNDCGQCNVGGWTDIVAVSAGFSHTVGLKSDGTVVVVGGNEDGQCIVRRWTDIKLPNK